MNTTHNTHKTPADEDRLMDAMLREHARAGSLSDEAFLTRLSTSLADQPAYPGIKTGASRFAWSLGVAASLAIVVGLAWNRQHSRETPVNPAEAAVASSRVPLQTGLPPELIEGTPKPINLPSLVPAPTKAPEFHVPEGTILLSRGKPVSGSDESPLIGSLDLITDGDKEAGEGYFVELLDGLQWVQIDLEKSAAIHAIWVWHFHSQKRAYHDVIVQISDDPDFRTGVTTVYNNDYDNSARMGGGGDHPYVETRFGRVVDGRGTKGRYVRLYSNGNSSDSMNHYIEVEVFGIPG